MRNSLIVKIVLPAFVAVVGLTIMASWVMGELFAQYHNDNSALRAARYARVIEAQFSIAPERGHAALAPFLLAACAVSDKSLAITDAALRVVYACDGTLSGAEIQPASTPGERVNRAGRDWLRHILPLHAEPACSACHAGVQVAGYLAFDVPAESTDSELKHLRQMNISFAVLLAVALAAMLVLAQLRLVFHPLQQVRNMVERFRAGDHSQRVAINQRDEIGDLAQSLNDMAASIEQATHALERTHQASLAQAEKLATLGQLTSSIAHEIKNPLAGIVGALKVLEGETAAGESKAVLGKVLAQVERLSQTVVSLMEYARPLDPAVQDVDIAELLEHSMFFVERQAAQQRVQLRKRFPPTLAHASADPDLMRQVFLNLMLNAVQAMPQGGCLDIEAGAHDGSVQVAFRDQGPGIAPEHLPMIFKPFFSTKKNGTGLGLYVARQMVQTQHGDITVTSVPGQGSCFTVRVPTSGRSEVGDVC